MAGLMIRVLAENDGLKSLRGRFLERLKNPLFGRIDLETTIGIPKKMKQIPIVILGLFLVKERVPISFHPHHYKA